MYVYIYIYIHPYINAGVSFLTVEPEPSHEETRLQGKRAEGNGGVANKADEANLNSSQLGLGFGA